MNITTTGLLGGRGFAIVDSARGRLARKDDLENTSFYDILGVKRDAKLSVIRKGAAIPDDTLV